MKAVENRKPVYLSLADRIKVPKITKEVDANELWQTITECAHKTAEPGLIFWDRQHYYSTSSVTLILRTAQPILARKLPCRVAIVAVNCGQPV